ncbi:TPA: EpsG family protein [Pluralibacter gergoviae]
MKYNYKQNYYGISVLLCFFLGSLAFLKPFYFSADFSNYVDIYDGQYDEIAGIEPFFRYITYYFHWISVPYVAFAMLACSLCLILKIIYARKILRTCDKDLILFLSIYFCFYGFLHELTQLRIAIASSICYVAVYQYFFRRNFLAAGLLSLIGMFFHYSIALWFLTLFINSYRRLLIFSLIFVFGFGFFIGFSNNIAGLLPNEKLVSYLYNLTNSVGIDAGLNLVNLNNFVFLSVLGIMSYLRTKVKLSVEASKFVDFVQCSNVMAFLFFYFFSGVPVIAYRLAELCRLFYPLAIVLMLVELNKSYSRIVMAVFTSFFILLSILMLFVTLRAVS